MRQVICILQQAGSPCNAEKPIRQTKTQLCSKVQDQHQARKVSCKPVSGGLSTGLDKSPLACLQET